MQSTSISYVLILLLIDIFREKNQKNIGDINTFIQDRIQDIKSKKIFY